MQKCKPLMAQSQDYGLNTVIWHSVFGENAEAALQSAKNEIIRLEALLSRYIPDSEINRINHSAGTRAVKISDCTYEVLTKAYAFSELCQGCFDVTIGPLVDLWRYSKSISVRPDETRIAENLALVNYQDLILDPIKKTAALRRAGQSIDLGGIGKGYAADQVLRILMKNGIKSAFTNFGGNVAAIGSKPDQSAWRIGIQHPRLENKLIGAVSVVNKSVVTSGDYQRNFTDQHGRKFHHILDPKTGYPSQSGLASVTVIADSAMAADALSTILFLTGITRGQEILKALPGTNAVFIDLNCVVYVTEGLKDFFQVDQGIEMRILA